MTDTIKKGLREKIAEILYNDHYLNIDIYDNRWYELTDRVLSLTHDEWEMVEECNVEQHIGYGTQSDISFKRGIITCPATIDKILQGKARRKR